MNVLRCAAVGFLLSTANATSINATEAVTGRWALDASFCTRWFGTAAQSPLIVTDSALRWSDDACRIERSYKTGDTVHIQALCWGDGRERSIPVSLRPHGGRLAVTWDRGSRGDMQRCP
jgi:hypothetical protein